MGGIGIGIEKFTILCHKMPDNEPRQVVMIAVRKKDSMKPVI